jgi:hypothetical protein
MIPIRYSRRQAALMTNLAFAPAVMAMRLPLLATEARGDAFSGVETALAISEKAEALAEGMAAAQLSLLASAMRFWPDLLAGRDLASIVDRAFEQAAHAALKPAGRRVRANYRRLSRR